MFTEKVYEVLHLLEWQSEVVIKSRKQGDKNKEWDRIKEPRIFQTT